MDFDNCGSDISFPPVHLFSVMYDLLSLYTKKDQVPYITVQELHMPGVPKLFEPGGTLGMQLHNGCLGGQAMHKKEAECKDEDGYF